MFFSPNNFQCLTLKQEDGISTSSEVGERLNKQVKVGTRVGLLLDPENTLLLFVDGELQGTVAANLHGQQHAAFQLISDWVSKVRWLELPIPFLLDSICMYINIFLKFGHT